MKKTFALLSLSTFVFVGCNAGANAQTSTQAVVGNPESANAVIVEQGYIVSNPQPQNIAPTAAQQQAPDTGAIVIEQETDTVTPDSETIEIDDAVVPTNN